MTPPVIEQAIAKVDGTILKCDPVCDGSKHYIVTFTAPAEVDAVEGAASLARISAEEYRIHFILN